MEKIYIISESQKDLFFKLAEKLDPSHPRVTSKMNMTTVGYRLTISAREEDLRRYISDLYTHGLPLKIG